jgi:hypothetical protein
VKVIKFVRISHVHLPQTLGILGDFFFSISQTERHSEFGRCDGLVYKKSREIPEAALSSFFRCLLPARCF